MPCEQEAVEVLLRVDKRSWRADLCAIHRGEVMDKLTDFRQLAEHTAKWQNDPAHRKYGHLVRMPGQVEPDPGIS